MRCPFKFNNYEFEGGQDCIGVECGMHKLCNAETEITAVEFDALDEHAQALERENAELRKLCGANDTLAAENDVSAESVDANDSRERLEADVQDFISISPISKYSLVQVDYWCVLEWLDRQAAITEAEQREWWGGVVAELQAKVDELTEQRDRWRSNWTERNIAYSELADDYQELEAKVDELTAELAAARKAHAQAEHDAETYREKLGRVLDMVQEMERVGTLVDQEGNVIG